MSEMNRLADLSMGMHRAKMFEGAVFQARQPFVGSPVNHARIDQVDQMIRFTTGVVMTASEFDTARSMIERARAWKG